MKVGILTYHRSINYGAFMQAYALSRRLNEIEGVEAEIIDYMSAKMDRYYKLFTIYRGKNGILRIGDRVSMYRAFTNSIKELSLSEQRLVSDDIERFKSYIEGRYDMIVVGSDAVWNYEKRGLPNPYFLIDVSVSHKVSYAASCNGIKEAGLDKEKLAVLKSSFSQFEYLGVRDELTESVVSKALGQSKAIHNCDPTLLLEFEKDGLGDEMTFLLLDKLERKYGWDPKKKHIGLMLSNFNGDLAETLVRNLKEKYGNAYQIVSIYSYCKYADIPYISNLSPFEWSRIFSMFDITFSKYFHGTLLSILNETPVISLSVEETFKNIPSKVEDVLDRLGLPEFYCPASGASDIEWNGFMKNVDGLINKPPVEKMRAGVEKERQSADSFCDYVESLAKEEE